MDSDGDIDASLRRPANAPLPAEEDAWKMRWGAKDERNGELSSVRVTGVNEEEKKVSVMVTDGLMKGCTKSNMPFSFLYERMFTLNGVE